MPKIRSNGEHGENRQAVEDEIARLERNGHLSEVDSTLVQVARAAASEVDRNPGSQTLMQYREAVKDLREAAVSAEDLAAAAIIYGVQVACADPHPDLKPFTRGDAHPQNGTGLCTWCFFEKWNGLLERFGEPPLTISEFADEISAHSPGKVDSDAYWAWKRRQMGMTDADLP